MPVWTHNGAAFVKVTVARLNLGAPALLCCPGPSLGEIDRDLRGAGRLVCAINSAYPKINPDLWIGLDKLACHPAKLWHEAFPKVLRMIDGNTDRVRNRMNVLYADMEIADPAEMFLRRDDSCTFIWSGNTLAFALHYLICSGAKKIHLLGCDMGGEKDYYDGRKLTAYQRAHNRALYEQQAAMIERLSLLSEPHGISFVSSTPDSPLNRFLPFQPWREVIAQIERALPADTPLLHSTDQ